MKVGIMQPYLFPYIGYFQLISVVDKFIILDDVNFIKKGYINRNKILVNGKAKTFTVPLEKASQNKLIMDIEIAKDNKQIGKTLKTIRSAYSRAPFFKAVHPLIEQSLTSNENKLSKFVTNSIKLTCEYLNIKTEIIDSTQQFEKKGQKGQNRILNILKQVGADQYINPFGGKDLYSKEHFNDQGVELFFHHVGDVYYKQFNQEFVPNLSIIDVMMFNSPEELEKKITDFKLY